MKLSPIKTPESIKQSLITSFPEELVQIKNDKNKSRYISGNSVIDKLNSTFGYLGWSWDIVKEWVQDGTPKIIKTRWDNTARKKIDLTEEEWIVEQQGNTAHIIGRLTVHIEKEDGSIHSISRMAPGSQPFTGGQSEQENAFKGAHTDSIKKAATTFGIALELYRKEPEQEYFEEINFEDPWTDEAVESNKENFLFLKEFKAKYNFENENLGEYVYECFSGEYGEDVNAILPDDMGKFVEYLKSVEEEEEE